MLSGKFLLAVIAIAVADSLIQWLFIGLLFHKYQAKTPSIWRKESNRSYMASHRNLPGLCRYFQKHDHIFMDTSLWSYHAPRWGGIRRTLLVGVYHPVGGRVGGLGEFFTDVRGWQMFERAGGMYCCRCRRCCNPVMAVLICSYGGAPLFEAEKAIRHVPNGF